ncbi:MAG TPA: DUF998 domain-containing protein [Actinocatenispora sp.]
MPTDRNHATAPRGHRTARAVLALVAVAVLCIAYLHAVLPLSPVRKMVSDYVHTPVGAAVLPVGLLAFAAALVLLARTLRTAGLANRRVVVPLVVAAVGLLLIAACHGDAEGTGTTLRGVVHKIGGGLLFSAVPLAGWALAGSCAAHPTMRAAAVPLRRMSALGAVFLVVFVLGYLPEFGVPVPGAWLATHTHGLLERAILGTEAVLVALPALRLARRPAALPARPAAPSPAVSSSRLDEPVALAGAGAADEAAA